MVRKSSLIQCNEEDENGISMGQSFLLSFLDLIEVWRRFQETQRLRRGEEAGCVYWSGHVPICQSGLGLDQSDETQKAAQITWAGPKGD